MSLSQRYLETDPRYQDAMRQGANRGQPFYWTGGTEGLPKWVYVTAFFVMVCIAAGVGASLVQS